MHEYPVVLFLVVLTFGYGLTAQPLAVLYPEPPGEDTDAGSCPPA